MSYIADGEFPDDELTDLTYMLESNDNYEELLHDLAREDDGPETKVRVGEKKFLLADIVRALIVARDAGIPYEEAVKPYVDGAI